MFNSLSSRVIWLGGLVVCALLALVGLLFDASTQTRASFGLVAHTQQVMQTLDETISNLREAESGQRGFLLTQQPLFVEGFGDRTRDAAHDVAELIVLTRDNPVQVPRAKALSEAVRARIVSLQEPLSMAARGRFAQAVAIISTGRGREQTIGIVARADEMMDEERRLLAERVVTADQRLSWNRDVALAGCALIALLVIAFVGMIVRGIRKPIGTILSAMERMGEGDRAARVTTESGSSEFEKLAHGYNTMAERLEHAVVRQADSDEELKSVNIELRHRGEVLLARGEIIELLSGMAHRMQAARTDEELADVIRCFAPRVLPGVPGALYAHNNSRNLLMPIANWGGGTDFTAGFAPDECWALRRGQQHFIAEKGTDIVCAHISDDDALYTCEPLLAGGEVIGMLHLQGVIEAGTQFRLTALSENIASALVNHRLQRGLREQTIRDPLTSLFNRRYMEESLALEIARASRNNAPLSLVMCDVDHFKRFNDDFGHDAGDVVLQAVSAEMARYFRDGDVVCRFGGEEFTIIAPGATPEALAERVERLRLTINELSVRQGGRLLGTVSMSFGIAGWDSTMARDGSTLVQLADAALYRAKREGRNRAVIDTRLAA